MKLFLKEWSKNRGRVVLVFASCILCHTLSFAQHIGFNNEDPQVTMDISGGFRTRPEVLSVVSNQVTVPANLSFVIIEGVPGVDFNIILNNNFEGSRLIIYNTTPSNGLLTGNNIIYAGAMVELIYTNDQWKFFDSNGQLTDAWLLNGNDSTDESIHFLGTLDTMDLIFKTNSENRMVIKQDGNVGIGTTSPDGKFQINHAADFDHPSILIMDSSNGNAGGGVLQFKNMNSSDIVNIKGTIGFAPDGSDTYLNFFRNYNTLMSLKGNGNLGVGDPDPAHRLSLARNNPNMLLLKNTKELNPGEANNITFESGDYRTAIISTVGDNASSARLRFSTGTSFIGGNNFLLERLTITSSGNVGINLINPTDKFEVNGNMSILGTNTLEFGKGIAGKEPNAGKIGYNAFAPNALAIVGAGNSATTRKVYIFAEAGTTFNGDAIVNTNAIVNGNIGVGTSIIPAGYRMAVDGKIIAEELRIQNSVAWPDFVFEEDYPLMPLSDIEKYITRDKHLPDVPSAAEVSQNGIAVGEMESILLRKLEELTLHIIAQDKRIQELELKISTANQ